jgi:hypothetical protein
MKMMTIDNEINRLKAQFGGRISAVMLHDANVGRQSVASAVGRHLYTIRLILSQSGRKTEIVAGEELGRISTFGEFDMPRFTINAKDRIGFESASAGNVRIGMSVFEVFAEDGQLTSAQRKILRSTELAELTRYHQFREGEALHFYRNGIVLYVRREDLSAELVSLQVALASILPAGTDDAESIELPLEFSNLVNISRDWALGDDLERSERIQNATEQELKDILAVVEPELEAINSYLGRFHEDPPSAAAANLARLAETAMEVKITLAHREGRVAQV